MAGNGRAGETEVKDMPGVPEGEERDECRILFDGIRMATEDGVPEVTPSCESGSSRGDRDGDDE